GAPVRWSALHEHRKPRRVPLPTYAFDTKRYWIDAPVSRESTAAGIAVATAASPAVSPRQTVAFEPPIPEPPAPDRPEVVRSAYTGPVSDTLTTVINLLEETLGTSSIGPDDDFFDLGGDS
ncbi:phosphopantetheine-binding protein, partial [Saccharothrix sp. ST-888]|uniref:phosphopantetheine-binding protein n=1 Tax=Saccharothrix sp. ST-888 TaxID=1427391 RepID=UPI0005EC7FA7